MHNYERPVADIWLIGPGSTFLSASNEDLPVVPVDPFRSKRKGWDDDDEWDD